MSEYLFLGGPANGQTREVEGDEPVTRYVSLPDSPSFGTLVPSRVTAGAAVIHSYARRELRVKENSTGRSYARVLYVHESVPSAQHMTNELMGWLLGCWVMAGAEIIEGEVAGGDTEGADSGA
jgi:hypothetical protein